MESGESPEAEEREAHPPEATEHQQEVRQLCSTIDSRVTLLSMVVQFAVMS